MEDCRKSRYELGGYAKDCFGAGLVGFYRLPGRLVGEVLIAHASQIHGMAKGFAELKCLKGFGYSCGLDRYGRQCLEVLGCRSRGRNPSATKLMVEDHDPVHQIAQNCHQL